MVIGPLGTNFSEILIGIDTFSFKKMHLKLSSGKCWPFCLGLNELKWSEGHQWNYKKTNFLSNFIDMPNLMISEMTPSWLICSEGCYHCDLISCSCTQYLTSKDKNHTRTCFSILCVHVDFVKNSWCCQMKYLEIVFWLFEKFKYLLMKWEIIYCCQTSNISCTSVIPSNTHTGAATFVPPLHDHKTSQVAVEGTKEAEWLTWSFRGCTEDVQTSPWTPWSQWSFEHVQNSRTKVAEEVGQMRQEEGTHIAMVTEWLHRCQPLVAP